MCRSRHPDWVESINGLLFRTGERRQRRHRRHRRAAVSPEYHIVEDVGLILRVFIYIVTQLSMLARSDAIGGARIAMLFGDHYQSVSNN